MSYVTYDPVALNKSRYGSNYGTAGNPGGVGWIDPTVVKSPGTAYINNSGSYQDQVQKMHDEINKNAANFVDRTPINNGTTSTTATPGLSTLRSLSNRKPTLANAWGGWSNQTGGQNTQGQGSNFTYFSRFS